MCIHLFELSIMVKRKQSATSKGKGRAKQPHAVIPDTDSDNDPAASESSTAILPQTESIHKRARTIPEELSLDVMKQIASFYEDHPMFYDVSDINYKSLQLKEQKLAELSAKIGVTSE